MSSSLCVTGSDNTAGWLAGICWHCCHTRDGIRQAPEVWINTALRSREYLQRLAGRVAVQAKAVHICALAGIVPFLGSELVGWGVDHLRQVILDEGVLAWAADLRPPCQETRQGREM
eukprot:3033514-Rhodomonas_salina.1